MRGTAWTTYPLPSWSPRKTSGDVHKTEFHQVSLHTTRSNLQNAWATCKLVYSTYSAGRMHNSPRRQWFRQYVATHQFEVIYWKTMVLAPSPTQLPRMYDDGQSTTYLRLRKRPPLVQGRATDAIEPRGRCRIEQSSVYLAEYFQTVPKLKSCAVGHIK